MFRALIVVVVGLVNPFQAFAQIPGIKETLVQVSPSSNGPGGWYDEVENLTGNTIVALHATFPCPETGPHPSHIGGFEFDPLIVYGGRQRPIPPGGSQRFFLQPWAVNCTGGVDAVLFSDGHSEGSQQLVGEIYKERLGVYDALAIVHKMMGNVISATTDPNAIADDLAARARTVSQNMNMDAKERLGQMSVFTLAATILRSQRDLHVPSDDTARRQPGIDAVMKASNIPRPQAHAHVIDNKLGEWSRDLEKYLQPSQ